MLKLTPICCILFLIQLTAKLIIAKPFRSLKDLFRIADFSQHVFDAHSHIFFKKKKKELILAGQSRYISIK